MSRRRLVEIPFLVCGEAAAKRTIGSARSIAFDPCFRFFRRTTERVGVNRNGNTIGTAIGSAARFSTGSGGSSYSASGPSQQLKSWESGARMVQNTTVENKYLEHIREVHDPSQHIKTIEDELKGSIGKALGKQGQKVLMYARLMEEERQRYQDLLLELRGQAREAEPHTPSPAVERTDDVDRHPELSKIAISHNEYREQCLHARWELIVHRQAVGFIVGNHKYVTDKFPVGDALPVPSEDGEDERATAAASAEKSKKKKVFTDQLDWWQRIGR
ncbi:unnamed protein product [Pseudo-nitzschia multistriata]|uniref:Uncharacterized protein n=1 Tax=Pseudo-nitzschia multistriata TaxID=183589 RepID=A0A448ZTS9_9STRA|nr:unnamed protein product [Pseudo-nitzschia multistriata]